MHQIFIETENENTTQKKWYYIEDRTELIKGPLNDHQMEKLWELKSINPKTKIKKKYDDEYKRLSCLIKKYFNRVLRDKLNLESRSTALSNKIINFKKGQLVFKKDTKKKENYFTRNRQNRALSSAVKPNFVLLTDMLPPDEDEEFEELKENCYSRMRAKTISN